MQTIVKGLLSTLSFTNPLLKDVEMGPYVANSLAWKVFLGTKKGTNEDISVFIFEKKTIEKFPKTIQENILANLRRDSQTLAKLRHPSVLRVLYPIEESKTDMVMIVEPIAYTLQTYCKTGSMEPLEIKMCMHLISDGLSFLHDAAGLLHRRICPDTIFTTSKGEWKIGGFGFSCAIAQPDSNIDFKECENNPSIDVFQVIANLDYIAPEVFAGQRARPASDIFALGRLGWYMMSLQEEVGLSARLMVEEYRTRLEKTIQINKPKIDPMLPLLTLDPDRRITADLFLRSDYFADTFMRALLFLWSFVQKDDATKLQFLKGLEKSLQNFTPRVLSLYVLYPLVGELKSEQLLKAVLPNIFIASNLISTEQFQTVVLPHLLPLFKDPRACATILLENLATVFLKSRADVANTYLIPFLLKAFSVNRVEVVGGALDQLPRLIGSPLLSVEVIRTDLLPRLQFICNNATSDQLKLKTVSCFAKLVPIIERYLTVEFIMPALTQLSHSNVPLPILMALVTVYEAVVQQFNAELLAEKLLPALFPLTVDKVINLDQFNAIMRIVKMAVVKLEQERTAELAKRTGDVAVPLTDNTNSQEWESFEMMQARMLKQQAQSQPVIPPQPQPQLQSQPLQQAQIQRPQQLQSQQPQIQPQLQPQQKPQLQPQQQPQLQPQSQQPKLNAQPPTGNINNTATLFSNLEINKPSARPLQPQQQHNSPSLSRVPPPSVGNPSTSSNNLFVGLSTKPNPNPNPAVDPFDFLSPTPSSTLNSQSASPFSPPSSTPSFAPSQNAFNKAPSPPLSPTYSQKQSTFNTPPPSSTALLPTQNSQSNNQSAFNFLDAPPPPSLPQSTATAKKDSNFNFDAPLNFGDSPFS